MNAIKTFALHGTTASLVTVTAEPATKLTIVSEGGNSPKEAQVRVRAALETYGYSAKARITVQGPLQTQMDLACLAAVLVAADVELPSEVRSAVLVGELSLGGRVQPVRGAVSFAMQAADTGDILVAPYLTKNEISDFSNAWLINSVGELVIGELIKACPRIPDLRKDTARLGDMSDIRGRSGGWRACGTHDERAGSSGFPTLLPAAYDFAARWPGSPPGIFRRGIEPQC